MEQMDSELAEYLYKNDRVVNDMERSIESQCLSIITRQQPVAGGQVEQGATSVFEGLAKVGHVRSWCDGGRDPQPAR